MCWMEHKEHTGLHPHCVFQCDCVWPNDWDRSMLSIRVVETEESKKLFCWVSYVICYVMYVKLRDMCWVEHEEHTGLHPQSVFQLHNVLRLDRTCSLNPESSLNHTDWQHISLNHLASNWHHNFSPRLAAMRLFLMWYGIVLVLLANWGEAKYSPLLEEMSPHQIWF